MYPAAEGHVARRVAIEIEGIRVVPAAWVAVGGTQEHEHLLVLGQRCVPDLDLGGGGPKERLDRSFHPQCFFKYSADKLRIFAPPSVLFWFGCQVVEHRRYAVDRGVYPCGQ